MKITIQNITIQNFKGFRDFQAQFNPSVASVYGDNGLGKTSIADAILWCLFGKDTQNRQQFDIKYHDANGKTEKNIVVSVSLDVLIDKVQHNITRQLKEQWAKERGTTNEYLKGNITEYFVDGQPYTQADFKAFMSDMVDERTFRAVTSPTLFTSLPWKEQRQFLSQMVGNISNEEIANVDFPRFKDVLPLLENETIESLLKSTSYKIKECKSKIAEIPVSIAALKKAMPEEPVESARTEEVIASELAEVRKQYELSTTSPFNAKREELSRKVNFAQKRLNEMRISASNMAHAEQTEYDKALFDHKAKKDSYSNKIEAFYQNINSKNVLIERTKKRLEECDVEISYLRKQWQEKVNCKFSELSEDEKYCPSCGQLLPDDQIEELRNKAYERFTRTRNENKERITKQVADVNKKKKECAELITEYEQDITQSKSEIQALETELSALHFEAVKPRTYDEILSVNDNYNKVNEELQNLLQELENVTDTPVGGELVNSLSEKITALELELRNAQKFTTISNEIQRITTLIAEEENKRIDYCQRLADLEQQEDTLRQFSNTADVLLEQKVNQHFSLVNWRMFRENINGTREPYCECYVNGTAFHDGLNSAGRINAGLDIINTLCRIYNLTAPVIIDNCESNNNILETESQQIRLYVSTDKQLTIN